MGLFKKFKDAFKTDENGRVNCYAYPDSDWGCLGAVPSAAV